MTATSAPRDNFGIEILPTDTLRITAWGGGVRLSDVGQTGTLVRVKRTGNIVVDLGHGNVITATPGQVSVARRDGLSGHQGNVGTAHDSHTKAASSDGLVDIVVVACGCGFLPLNSHLTSAAAWRFAADHVALNPSLCTPTMHRDRVPAALAPKG